MSVAFTPLVLSAIGLPLLLCMLLAWLDPATRWMRRLLVLAPLPALLLALLPPGQAELYWVLVGSRLASGGFANAMLLLIGVVWPLAGWYAADRVDAAPRRFALWWLLSLAGIVLAVLAADLASFYFGYALMSLAAYGLVVHSGSDEARRAGRVYLTMAILAEGAVLAGVLLLVDRYGLVPLALLPHASAVDGAAGTLVGWLLLAGFGVKIGVVGLHLWLPVAHPAAPVPASAVLSGVIVKAGLFGLVRLLPAEALPGTTGGWIVVLGLVTAFYGVVVGLAQSRLKTVLAYSTISQMGLLFAAAGLALGAAERELMMPLLGLLVLHHGLNKAALFIGAGCVPFAGRTARLLMALPALALVALPLSTGALAKQGLKLALDEAGHGVGFVVLLGLSSAATALLMWRAFVIASSARGRPRAIHPAWPMLVVAGLLLPWLWASTQGLGGWPAAAGMIDGLWPPALAALALWAWSRAGERRRAWDLTGRIPEGDLLVPVENGLAALWAWLRRRRPWIAAPPLPRATRMLQAAIADGEQRLGSVAAAGLALLVLLALVWLGWRA